MNNKTKIIHLNPNLNDHKKTDPLMTALVENLRDIDKQLEKYLDNDRYKK